MAKGLLRKDGTLRGVWFGHKIGPNETDWAPCSVVGYPVRDGFVIVDGEEWDANQNEVHLSRSALIRMLDDIVLNFPEA